MFSLLKLKEKSGKRDSDPRPQPWQGCALPTELFPQGKINGEEEETRTPTTQLSLPPQSSASTNSATSPTSNLKIVPKTGLEPARCETHAPETCASTNSATWAQVYKIIIL